jgi:hypothetical protein
MGTIPDAKEVDNKDLDFLRDDDSMKCSGAGPLWRNLQTIGRRDSTMQEGKGLINIPLNETVDSKKQ